jgi:DNA (cytosine-5)-methyltransferase 1
LLSNNKAFTLATSNFHTVFLFEATRVEDVRIYEKYSPTVATYWGTGGARVPYVFPIQGTVIGRSDNAGPQGKVYGEDGEVMFTLDRVSGHAIAYSFDSLASNSMKSNNPNSGCREVDKSKTLDTSALNPNANQGGMAIMSQLVRRLTPTECERLQGFPDGWTDGQADSHRYKQMGNAVAVPVVQWIINRIVS